MFRLRRSLPAAALLLFALLGSFRAEAEIKLGILPRLGPVELFTMFNPLAEYLTMETGEKVSVVIPKDFEAFKAAVKAGQIDLAFANPVIYVQLKNELSVEPLAVADELGSGTKFRGVIIARKESGIKKISDLKGRRLAFVDKDSAAGYIFQVLLLSKAGIDIRKDVTVLPFAKKHDTVMNAVINGAADAGGVREEDIQQLQRKAEGSQLRVVAYTDYYLNWPVFAGPGMDKEMKAKVRTMLLKLKPGLRLSREFLGPARLNGFSPVSDTAYQPVREAARQAGAF